MQPAAGMLGSRNRSEGWSNTDKTADRRQYCQHCQRHPHRRRGLVRDMRTVHMATVFMRVSVRCDVMRDAFVHWSNVFTGLVSRAIAGGWAGRVMRSQAFVVSRSV